MTHLAATRRAILTGLGAGVLAGCGTAAATSRSEGLDAAVDGAMADGASSVLVAGGGDILAERYAPGWDADRPREVASVAKSMVAVLLGMAVEDGAIDGFDQPAHAFIPAWRDDGRAAITLRHMMSMTSGLDDTDLALRDVSGDQFAINAAMPLRDQPGARWAYNTAAYHLLFHVLARATGESVETYAARRLLGPLGMTGTSWITDVGRGEAGAVTSYYSAMATARDLRRFASLVHERGAGLLRPDTIHALTSPSQEANPSYGLLWWTNARPGFDAFGAGPALRFPEAPADTVAALGAGGQIVIAIPSRGLTLVRQGDPPRSAVTLGALLRIALTEGRAAH